MDKLNWQEEENVRMMKKLFVCERPYILYKSLIKAASDKDNEIDIIVSNHMPGMEKVIPYVENSGLFNKTFFFDDEGYQEYTKNEKISDYIKFPKILISWPQKLKRYFRYQKIASYAIIPKGLDFAKYDEIVCNDGVSVINFIMYKLKIPHIVSEHAKNNFQIKVTLHILAVYLTVLLDRIGLIPAYSGMSKYVSAIEVTENKNLVRYIRHKRIIECNVEKLKKSLSDEQRECIFGIYANAYKFPFLFGQSISLILTSPLAIDGLVASEMDQVNCYRSMIREYSESGQVVVIKPHPRDKTDYCKFIDEVKVLPNSVSAEILGISTSLHIEKVITMGSTAALAFQSVRKYVILGPEYLERFHPTMQSNQFKSLKDTADYVRKHVGLE